MGLEWVILVRGLGIVGLKDALVSDYRRRGKGIRWNIPIELTNKSLGGLVYGELSAKSMRFRTP